MLLGQRLANGRASAAGSPRSLKTGSFHRASPGTTTYSAAKVLRERGRARPPRQALTSRAGVGRACRREVMAEVLRGRTRAPHRSVSPRALQLGQSLSLRRECPVGPIRLPALGPAAEGDRSDEARARHVLGRVWSLPASEPQNAPPGDGSHPDRRSCRRPHGHSARTASGLALAKRVADPGGGSRHQRDSPRDGRRREGEEARSRRPAPESGTGERVQGL